MLPYQKPKLPGTMTAILVCQCLACAGALVVFFVCLVLGIRLLDGVGDSNSVLIAFFAWMAGALLVALVVAAGIASVLGVGLTLGWVIPMARRRPVFRVVYAVQAGLQAAVLLVAAASGTGDLLSGTAFPSGTLARTAVFLVLAGTLTASIVYVFRSQKVAAYLAAGQAPPPAYPYPAAGAYCPPTPHGGPPFPPPSPGND